MVRRRRVRGFEKGFSSENVMWKSHHLKHFQNYIFLLRNLIISHPANYKHAIAVWANLISKYFPLQFHLLSRQHCEKPLWCFPRLRARCQEDLTSHLFSQSSTLQQPFRSCGEGTLECVSPCKVPDVISVPGWNAEVSPDWKMCLLMATFNWPCPNSAASTLGLQLASENMR